MKFGLIAAAVLLAITPLVAQDKPKIAPPDDVQKQVATQKTPAQLPKDATKVIPATAEEKQPELTSEQKLQLDNLLLLIANAQKDIQLATLQREQFVKAAGELIQSLQRDGYDFDYQAKTYTKKK